MSNLNERQFPVGHATPLDSKGSPLFAHPDIDGPNHVPVKNMAHLSQVIQSKSAHRWDENEASFKQARVHEWSYHDSKTRQFSRFPAGGTLRDERVVGHS